MISRAGMIAVFARPGDPAPAQLAGVGAGEVGHVTCGDLSRPGWRYRLGAPQAGQAVIEGRTVPAGDIAAVVVRQGWVVEGDMPWIVEEDRCFVAAETQAFLLAFLAALECPVWNAATATCLAGPMWRPSQWRHAAARCGLEAVGDDGPEPTVSITVAGNQCFGAPNADIAAGAVRVAALAGAAMLSLDFAGPGPRWRLRSAHPWPDLAHFDVASAVVQQLLREP